MDMERVLTLSFSGGHRICRFQHRRTASRELIQARVNCVIVQFRTAVLVVACALESTCTLNVRSLLSLHLQDHSQKAPTRDCFSAWFRNWQRDQHAMTKFLIASDDPTLQ